MQINSAIQQQYIDSVLQSLHDQMVETGLNNLELPDTQTNFSKRRLGVTWQGEANLFNGNLKGLETIHRTGEAVITLNIDGVTVDVEVGINDPLVHYDIHATFMKHGPKGTIAGSLSHITCDVQLNFIPGSETVSLEKLVVKDIGSLKARITGLGSVLNFIVSHVLQVVGNRVKWRVSTMLEGVIKDLLNDIISKTPLPGPTLDPTPGIGLGLKQFLS